ncbi:DUF3783 domain-containing protein [Pleomorphochaeta sp. DL1XJH-081]|jgi:hypothetical protein|uniref:DUF3783 domain-containing protein n=1 Tax=Pleomorphochaeta sp. DL1XJH-081 TaxID=3409690 RepID=UPI003BB5F4F0
MEQIHEDKPTEKVVILHGFTNEQIFAVLRAVKREIGTTEDVAFATTTAHSLEMKLKEVVKDVSEEHAYMKKNPPNGTRTPSN